MNQRRFEVGKSLTPVGFTFPMSAERLADEDRFSWAEKLIARMWEKKNIVVDDGLFTGPPLIAALLHRCTDKCKTETEDGPVRHVYCVPPDDEVRAASAAIQWLASNMGSYFINEFIKASGELNRVRPIGKRMELMDEFIRKLVP